MNLREVQNIIDRIENSNEGHYEVYSNDFDDKRLIFENATNDNGEPCCKITAIDETMATEKELKTDKQVMNFMEKEDFSMTSTSDNSKVELEIPEGESIVEIDEEIEARYAESGTEWEELEMTNEINSDLQEANSVEQGQLNETNEEDNHNSGSFVEYITNDEYDKEGNHIVTISTDGTDSNGNIVDITKREYYKVNESGDEELIKSVYIVVNPDEVSGSIKETEYRHEEPYIVVETKWEESEGKRTEYETTELWEKGWDSPPVLLSATDRVITPEKTIETCKEFSDSTTNPITTTGKIIYSDGTIEKFTPEEDSIVGKETNDLNNDVSRDNSNNENESVTIETAKEGELPWEEVEMPTEINGEFNVANDNIEINNDISVDDNGDKKEFVVNESVDIPEMDSEDFDIDNGIPDDIDPNIFREAEEKEAAEKAFERVPVSSDNTVSPALSSIDKQSEFNADKAKYWTHQLEAGFTPIHMRDGFKENGKVSEFSLDKASVEGIREKNAEFGKFFGRDTTTMLTSKSEGVDRKDINTAVIRMDYQDLKGILTDDAFEGANKDKFSPENIDKITAYKQYGEFVKIPDTVGKNGKEIGIRADNIVTIDVQFKFGSSMEKTFIADDLGKVHGLVEFEIKGEDKAVFGETQMEIPMKNPIYGHDVIIPKLDVTASDRFSLGNDTKEQFISKAEPVIKEKICNSINADKESFAGNRDYIGTRMEALKDNSETIRACYTKSLVLYRVEGASVVNAIDEIKTKASEYNDVVMERKQCVDTNSEEYFKLQVKETETKQELGKAIEKAFEKEESFINKFDSGSTIKQMSNAFNETSSQYAMAKDEFKKIDNISPIDTSKNDLKIDIAQGIHDLGSRTDKLGETNTLEIADIKTSLIDMITDINEDVQSVLDKFNEGVDNPDDKIVIGESGLLETADGRRVPEVNLDINDDFTKYKNPNSENSETMFDENGQSISYESDLKDISPDDVRINFQEFVLDGQSQDRIDNLTSETPDNVTTCADRFIDALPSLNDDEKKALKEEFGIERETNIPKDVDRSGVDNNNGDKIEKSADDSDKEGSVIIETQEKSQSSSKDSLSSRDKKDILREATGGAHGRVDITKNISISKDKIDKMKESARKEAIQTGGDADKIYKEKYDKLTEKLETIKQDICKLQTAMEKLEACLPGRAKGSHTGYQTICANYDAAVRKYEKLGGDVGRDCFVVRGVGATTNFYNTLSILRTNPLESVLTDVLFNKEKFIVGKTLIEMEGRYITGPISGLLQGIGGVSNAIGSGIREVFTLPFTLVDIINEKESVEKPEESNVDKPEDTNPNDISPNDIDPKDPVEAEPKNLGDVNLTENDPTEVEPIKEDPIETDPKEDNPTDIDPVNENPNDLEPKEPNDLEPEEPNDLEPEEPKVDEDPNDLEPEEPDDLEPEEPGVDNEPNDLEPEEPDDLEPEEPNDLEPKEPGVDEDPDELEPEEPSVEEEPEIPDNTKENPDDDDDKVEEEPEDNDTSKSDESKATQAKDDAMIDDGIDGDEAPTSSKDDKLEELKEDIGRILIGDEDIETVMNKHEDAIAEGEISKEDIVDAIKDKTEELKDVTTSDIVSDMCSEFTSWLDNIPGLDDGFLEKVCDALKFIGDVGHALHDPISMGEFIAEQITGEAFSLSSFIMDKVADFFSENIFTEPELTGTDGLTEFGAEGPVFDPIETTALPDASAQIAEGVEGTISDTVADIDATLGDIDTAKNTLIDAFKDAGISPDAAVDYASDYAGNLVDALENGTNPTEAITDITQNVIDDISSEAMAGGDVLAGGAAEGAVEGAAEVVGVAGEAAATEVGVEALLFL